MVDCTALDLALKEPLDPSSVLYNDIRVYPKIPYYYDLREQLP